MDGSLNDILPEPISPENERALLDLLRRKMMVSLDLAVEVLHAMEGRFGPEAREVIRDLAKEQAFDPRMEVEEPEADLREFCARADAAAAGSHRWQRVTDERAEIGYHYTRCMYAEILRELGEPELGLVICARDEPWVRSWNPRLAFRRTKTLMEGDDVCDHVFFVREETPR
jgi:hypothetical protein